MKTTTNRLDVSGGLTELGTLHFQGRSFTAGGGYLSEDRMLCYPTDNGHATWWSGEIMGRALLTCVYQQWNPLSCRYDSRTCWRVVLPDGRQYQGRNGGPGVLLKARRVLGERKQR